MSFIQRIAHSNAFTLVFGTLSGRGAGELDAAVTVRTSLGAKRIDWLQAVLLAVAFLSIGALFFIDIYG